MAKTTSKSTKAKTKTSVSKKTESAKVAKPVAVETKEVKATKAPEKKPSVTKTPRAKKPFTANSLRKLHALSIVVFAALAVAVAAVMKATSLSISSGHLTRNELASDGGTVFVAAQRVVYDIDIRYVLIALLIVSALLTFGRMRRMWKAEQAGVARRILPWRWFDFAITGMLAVETTALVSGLSDMVAVKALGLLTVASVVFAWLAERENAGSTKAVRAPYYASVAFGVITTLLLAAPLVDSLAYADVRATWYVYALWYVVALTFLFSGWNQYKAYKHGAVWNYLYIERNYVLINLVAKTAFALVLIVGLAK